MEKPRIVFFGTPQFSAQILNELEEKGIVPTLIVASPDKPKGRKLVMTPPETKVWAEARGIDVLQPAKITDEFIDELGNTEWDLFIVASYGKILPQRLLDLPKKGVLNVHPSLLPRLRGASPIRSAILEDEKETGVTIMLIDAEMDHGPIVAQARVEVEAWPPKASLLEALLAHTGGELLAEVIPLWLLGKITPEEQDHDKATFTKKIKKEDALIDLSADAYQNLLKIKAYDGWPEAYFITQRNGKDIRVKIIDAELVDGKLVPTRVVPEGKKEMDYKDFVRGNR
jgi:methionyl-tRNA formyltransferase